MKSDNTLPLIPPLDPPPLRDAPRPQIYTALLNESALCYTNIQTHNIHQLIIETVFQILRCCNNTISLKKIM